VGSSAGVDAVVKRKIHFQLLQGPELPIIQPVAHPTELSRLV
jgi:hypothetical protein